MANPETERSGLFRERRPDANAAAPGPTPMPAEELAAMGAVPLIAASFRRAQGEMPESLRAAFREHGLGPRHGAVLTQLMAREPASVTELAQRLQVSLSTASELVGALGRAGLVHREADPANRRRTLVSLPEHVRPVFEEFLAVRTGPLRRALDGLSERDRQGFLVGLEAWAREEQEFTESGGRDVP